MRIIAHRGNVTGPCKDENCPEHIDKAISLGYDVEVTVMMAIVSAIEIVMER